MKIDNVSSEIVEQVARLIDAHREVARVEGTAAGKAEARNEVVTFTRNPFTWAGVPKSSYINALSAELALFKAIADEGTKNDDNLRRCITVLKANLELLNSLGAAVAKTRRHEVAKAIKHTRAAIVVATQPK